MVDNEVWTAVKTIFSGGVGAAIATGLYKLFFRVLDGKDSSRDKKIDRVKELEAELLPAIKQAAELPWCQKRCDELRIELQKTKDDCEKEIDELKLEARIELEEMEKRAEDYRVKWVQAETVAQSYSVMGKFFNNPEGHAYIRAQIKKLDDKDKTPEP